MTFRDLIALQAHLNRGGEVEKAQRVGNRGPTLPNPLSHLFLGPPKIIHEPPKRTGRLHWADIFADKVFNEGKGKGLFICQVTNDDRNLGQPRFQSGTITPLSCDDLVATGDPWAH